MRTITVRRPMHLTSMEAYGYAEEAYEGGYEISDDVAVTIASLFASPGSVGRHMASLASTGTVRLDDLLDDIYATRRYAALGDHQVLDMLATWAINHD